MKRTNIIYLAIGVIALALLLVSVTSRKQQLPEKAPEISLFNQEGKIQTLSSLKGNYVLVDFWAGWCSPCRRENQKLVQSYRYLKDSIYKNEAKLIILSVSIDKDTMAWRKAIKNDRLFWPHQVIDPHGWDSKTIADWGVKSIPASFLVDPTGNIIAKNVVLNELDNLIKQHDSK